MPQTKIHSKNLQRAIIQQLNKIELWLLHTALLLNVIYLWVKFVDTSFYTSEVIPQTKTKSSNLQRAITINDWNRVMVLEHCTSPQCDLSVYEV